jgi:hypothetical protein
LWEIQEDRYDTRFVSNTGALGIKNQARLGSGITMENGLALSGIHSSRVGDFINKNYQEIRLEEDRIDRTMLAYQGQINFDWNSGNNFMLGLNLQHYQDQLFQSFSTIELFPPEVLIDGTLQQTILQPFAEWETVFLPEWKLKLGISASSYSESETVVAEPRAALTWHPDPNQLFSLAFGRHSQTQNSGTLLTVAAANNSVNLMLKPTIANHYVAGYRYKFSQFLQLNTEIYYQRLSQVPVAPGANRNFSVINLIEEYVREPLVNNGKGENYGLEVSLDKKLNRNYYFNAAGTLYKAFYFDAAGERQDSRFNGNYLFTFSAGREFLKQTRNRSIGVNLRGIYQGGFREGEIDLENSKILRRTVYFENAGFPNQLPDYFRLDLRLSHTRQKKGYTRIWSLDIQNLANTQNLAYRYFDPLQGAVNDKYQLGTLPFINYRIEF